MQMSIPNGLHLHIAEGKRFGVLPERKRSSVIPQLTVDCPYTLPQADTFLLPQQQKCPFPLGDLHPI